MLSIREEQLAALKETPEAVFVERVCGHLRKAVPDSVAGLSRDELREFVGRGIARARELRIGIEWDVCRLVEYRARWGEDFEASPDHADAARILHAPDLGGTAKLDLLDYHRLNGSD